MDTVDAEKNIEIYYVELLRYQSLSRSLMSRDEMIMVDNKIIQLKERIKNLRSVLSS